FGNQDSIGIWSWTDVARRAGVRDTARFSACRGAVPADARVARDMAVGQMLHVAATPTIIVQGLLLPGAPTVETLDSLTRLVLAGRTLTAPSVAGASRK
ncbi:MAG TPA: hypothetical protein VK636_09340, partial [Gemmatimonadaceae bacterium]|nr:hypothetical protein [Gemmatimonadaceae bacterium]